MNSAGVQADSWLLLCDPKVYLSFPYLCGIYASFGYNYLELFYLCHFIIK